jgi:hypothetical protein
VSDLTVLVAEDGDEVLHVGAEDGLFVAEVVTMLQQSAKAEVA